MGKLSIEKIKEKTVRIEDAFKSEQYKQSIALADELISEIDALDAGLNATEELINAREGVKRYPRFIKAVSCRFCAEDILRGDMKFKMEDEANELLHQSISMLYDFADKYGWDDSVIYEIMLSCDDLGWANATRNLAILLMNSVDQVIRSKASCVYDRNTDKLFYDFDLFKKDTTFYFEDATWFKKWYLTVKWKNDDEFIEFSKETANKFKFTNGILYQDRKYVFIGRNREQISGTYQFIDNERIVNWIFTIDRLPADMVFPLGRPQPGLYMAHPVKTDRYYPMKGAEESLFMEKVREFCWLVQCLGATEVSFHSNKGLSVSQGMGESMNVNAEVGVRKVSVGGGYSNSMKRDESYTSNQQVELVQHFSPKKQAYCPDDLIWLNSDSAWQMLLKQRLEGGIMEYTYKISSSETCQVSANEMEEVKANFEYIMVKANGSYNAATDNTFSRNEETEWSLYVKFAPMEELAGQNSSNTKGDLNLSDDEAEYLDMVKECLEDGEIGARERKLLDKIRVKNGISEERAKELEETLSTPQLTDDEKEYLEAFRDACEDGKVSDKQRRLLEKMRVMYGISEERAKEIEKH